MVKVVVVDKNSNKKETVLNYERSEFYKKCNYRNNNNFDLRHIWEFKEKEKLIIFLYLQKIKVEQIVKINMIFLLL